MTDPIPELPERIRKAIKAQPELTPPETFYESVMKRIDGDSVPQPHTPTSPRPYWRHWAIPATSLAAACVVMFMVLVKNESQPKVEMISTSLSTVERDAYPAPLTLGVRRKDLPAKGAPPPAKPVESASDEIDARLLDREISEQADRILKEKREETSLISKQAALARNNSMSEKSPLLSRGYKGTAGAPPAGYSLERVAGLASEPMSPKMEKTPQIRWSGIDSGILAARNEVIRDALTWRALWNEHAPKTTVPPVDFTHQMVIAIFLGERPTGGYRVEITKIRTLPDQLAVEYQEVLPEEGMVHSQALTYPYVMKVIPKTNLFIHFHPLRNKNI